MPCNPDAWHSDVQRVPSDLDPWRSDDHLQMVQEAFDEMDSDHDGCLYHMEVVRLLRRFLPDMYQKEVRPECWVLAFQ